MRDSLKQRAYREISRLILCGRLAPGEFVNRRNMARDLDMSVAPVLEAMLMLESEGLLETLPRRGTRVRVHRLEDVRGIFLVREALECQVAREIFGTPVAAEWPRLLVLAQAVDTASENAPPLWEAEVAFHCALADLMGSPVFSEAFRKAMRADLFYKLRQAGGGGSGSRRSHVRFLRALRAAKTPAEADVLTRSDLRHGKGALGLDRPPEIPLTDMDRTQPFGKRGDDPRMPMNTRERETRRGNRPTA